MQIPKSDNEVNLSLVRFVISITLIQGETPPELIGKVLAALMVLPFIGQSIGYPLQGRLFEQFATSPWLVVFGSVFIMMITAVVSYKYFKTAIGIK